MVGRPNPERNDVMNLKPRKPCTTSAKRRGCDGLGAIHTNTSRSRTIDANYFFKNVASQIYRLPRRTLGGPAFLIRSMNEISQSPDIGAP